MCIFTFGGIERGPEGRHEGAVQIECLRSRCGSDLCRIRRATGLAQQGGPSDQPAVTVRGQTYTPRSILARNMGTEEDQTTAFPPHKVIGNVYYVGTKTLSSFL